MSHPESEYRYERKFLMDDASPEWAEAAVRIHPSLLRERYAPRYVNNIYFDSHSLEAYRETLAGLPERKKIRIRWYGDLLGAVESPRLEIKLKRGFIGRKLSWPLPPFRLEPGFRRPFLDRVLEESVLPPAMKLELRTLQMVLLNRYRRKYYESASRSHRLTLDDGLVFYRMRPLANRFMTRAAADGRVIVELKYRTTEDESAREFLRHLPLRLTRSSKFVMGVEGLGW